MQNGPFFPQNALVINFSYEYRTFFIHSKKYSFQKNLIIHSLKIFNFCLKGSIGHPETLASKDCEKRPRPLEKKKN